MNGSPKSPLSTPTRRNSWLSSLSSKFTGTHPAGPNSNPSSPSVSSTATILEAPDERSLAPAAPRNPVLQHAVKDTGDTPYVPAPPKSSQPSFLQSALRRLSSSGGNLSAGARNMHHGLCERRVLNVDQHRERCSIAELDQSKLRRVAFCVDVEIASGPRYIDDEEDVVEEKTKKAQKRLTERGEGDALKRTGEFKNDKRIDGTPKSSPEKIPQVQRKEALESKAEVKEDAVPPEKETTKKKEKKKRSEEERKARKEKRRRNDEMNGKVPCELILNASDSSNSTPSGTPKTQASPTTDPVRIYRRCCQLRESPILKKITEQLTLSISNAPCPGVVAKLDLSGYWLQLPDLITLGDYLAVVPIKELILENMSLTDEGVRVILAGLLAAKYPACHPSSSRSKTPSQKAGEVSQGGVIERLVLKNNSRIGKDGWRHICLFINMCRSLKSLDLSKIPFPQNTTTNTASPSSTHLKRTMSNTSSGVSCLLAKAIGDRLAGAELELLNMTECGINAEQLGGLIDGVTKSGLRRLGIAGNNINSEGMDHVARWIREGSCEGLDLGGNDLKDLLGKIADALEVNESSNLYALSLAGCNLNPDSLWTLFPALAKLQKFRFIDLSQNHDLFASDPSALSLFRR